MSQPHNHGTTVAFGIAAVMLLLLGLYSAAYAWRWRQVRWEVDVSAMIARPKFPTAFEDAVFVPAMWVHRQVDNTTFDRELEIEVYPDPGP
jgi:hypothetical protein